MRPPEHPCWLLLALLTVAPAFAAEPAATPGAVSIEADRAELDEQLGVRVFEGHVVIRQADAVLEADRVTVELEGGAARRFLAEGAPARFRQPATATRAAVEAQARRASYDPQAELLELTGGAELRQGGDRFASERIAYDRARDRVRAGAPAGEAGGGRVRVTIEPVR